MLRFGMSGFQGPVYLALRPSSMALRMLAATHAAAVGSIVLLYPFTVSQCMLLLAIGANAAVCLRHHLRARPDDVVAVLLSSADTWQLSLRNGETVAARLHGEPWVTPWLTVLALEFVHGRVARVALFADSTDANALRRLRVRLLHGGAALEDA